MKANKYLILAIMFLGFFLPKKNYSQPAKLLIIAPDEFIEELKPVKQFKNSTLRYTILLLRSVSGCAL